MDTQAQLVALLKKKGTGPTMSKSLQPDDLKLLDTCLKDPKVNITTKATIITAILTLPPNPHEAKWIDAMKQEPGHLLPPELETLFFTPHPSGSLQSAALTAIARTDLDYDTFAAAMTQLMSPDTPNYVKGAFLEAERLKRETLEENSACFDALWEVSHHTQANIDTLIDLANPYDGFNRYPSLSLFVAPLLASIGYPVVINGCKEVAPKKGVTAHKLLAHTGKSPSLSVTQAKAQLETPDIGWAYIDQSITAPKIHDLVQLRTDMVKRPILATVEKLMQPFTATHQTILVTGYTHPPYKEMLQNILKLKQKYTRTLIFRGQEGAIQLPLDRRAPYVYFDAAQTTTDFVRPEEFDLDIQPQTPIPDITVAQTADAGLEALNSKPGQNRQILVYLAASILTLTGLMPKDEALNAITDSLDSGRALAHWNQAS